MNGLWLLALVLYIFGSGLLIHIHTYWADEQEDDDGI